MEKETELDAKASYSVLNAGASKLAHQKAPENHAGAAGKYIKSIVYGGLDGIITIFAVVASIAGAGYNVNAVIIMGVAGLLADGISMGMGDFLSSKAENDYTNEERKREVWECENYIEGEMEEMIRIYTDKGMTEEDAHTIVTTMAKYRDIFVDTMMVEELGLMPVDESDSPLKNGFVTFLSFLAFGCVPMISYIAAVGGDKSHKMNHVEGGFIIAGVITLFTMFALGALTSKFSPTKWYIGGAWISLNGGAAAAIAYFIGWALSAIVHGSPCGGV
eukprot:Phypoly_transcript_14404.p1 GENE.Phypoly_transcript_14404~~Phypoly_transcript_14404.p1  ORF type:complete len:276 (+),score=46.42 Phypoly_transcript_14404:99-926(+)